MNQLLDIFYSMVIPIVQKYTPKKRPKNERFPIWYSPSLIKALKEKSKYHSKYKKYDNPMDKLTFNLLRKRCDTMIKECYNKFKNNASENLRLSPKYFWRYLNDKKSNSASIPNEMQLLGRVARGGQAVAHLFAEYFQEVYDASVNVALTNIDSVTRSYHGHVDVPMSNCLIKESEVLDALKSLDVGKGPGPDGLPPILLQNCAETLHKPLHKIFLLSLHTGCFPTRWKLAFLTPIHKSGSLNDVRNYRPISMLSICGKVFESIVYKKVQPHIKTCINSNQHGFLPYKSTASNLVEYISEIAEALDKNEEVHAIYTDFTKAFDLVNHDILIVKLANMGIHGSLLRWCTSYLGNRSQLVALRGYQSHEFAVPSGVPQGSHLGPMFFLIFINDMCHSIGCKYKLFADDLKLYHVVKSLSDVEVLQSSIDRVQKWCVDNGMILNPDKCFHIKFSRKKKPQCAFYSIGSVVLKEVTTIRDLGVIIDGSLSFRQHVDHIVKKTSQLSGFINRQMKIFKQPSLTITIYNSIIRSILEYCSVVWNPGYQVHSDRIERVQKRFFYHLAYSDNKCRTLASYADRIKHYKVTSLEVRRRIADTLYCHGLIHARIDSPDVLKKLNFSVPRVNSRLHNRKMFAPPLYKSNLGRHSPINRMCLYCNAVRFDVDLFSVSLNELRIKLKTIYKNK